MENLSLSLHQQLHRHKAEAHEMLMANWPFYQQAYRRLSRSRPRPKSVIWVRESKARDALLTVLISLSVQRWFRFLSV